MSTITVNPLVFYKKLHLLVESRNKLKNAIAAEKNIVAVKNLLDKNETTPKEVLEISVNQAISSEGGRVRTGVNIKNQAALIRLALDNGAKFSEIKTVVFTLPSEEASKAMFEREGNKIDPDKFFCLVMNSSFFGKEQQKAKEKLIKIALNNGADPNKIERFGSLPDANVCELLLENKLDPSKFLNLIFGAYISDTDESAKKRQQELVEIAIKRGAKSNLLLEISVNQAISSEGGRVITGVNIKNQAALIRLALDNGAKFSEIKTVVFTLPSEEASKAMFEREGNKIDPDKFFCLVMNSSFFGKEQQKAKEKLIKIALNNGADPNKIERFGSLPDANVCELLLENKLDPSKFLNLVVSTYISNTDEQAKKRQQELVEIAIKRGAKSNLLLEISVNQAISSEGGRVRTGVNIKNQAALIRLALDNGAKFPEIKTDGFTLPSEEASKAMFEREGNKIDPDKFLCLVMSSSVSGKEQQKAKEKLIEMALNKGADPNKIEGFGSLPNARVCELLLSRKLDPSKFLNLIFSKFISNTDEQSKEQQLELTKLALNKGADPNKIERFGSLPDANVCELLLTNKLDPSKFLNLIVSKYISNTDEQSKEQQLELTKFALNKGADLNKIESFNSLPDTNVCELLLKNKLDPSKFLNLILNVPNTDYKEFKQEQLKLIQVALDKNADPNKIKSFYSIPNKKACSLLLEKNLDPSKFLNLVLNANTKVLLDKQGEILQLDLVKFALNREADPNKIESFSSIPSLPVCKLFLNNEKHKLEANKFLDLILSSPIDILSEEYFTEQKELQQITVGMLINEYHANIKKFKNPEVIDSFEKKEQFIGRNQMLLQKQLALILDRFGNPEDKKLSEKFKNSFGHCRGLTILYLYSNWNQFAQNGVDKYNKEWFKKTVKMITTWDRKSNVSEAEMETIKDFAKKIHSLQSTKSQKNHMFDFEKELTANGLTFKNKNCLEKKYSIVTHDGALSLEKIKELIEKNIYDDELIFCFVTGHVTSIFKHGNNYYFYDPNDNKGEYKDDLIGITKTIHSIFGKKVDSLGLIVIGDSNNSYTYLNQKDFLESIPFKKQIKKESLVSLCKFAADVCCLESLEFFLDLSKEKLGTRISFSDFTEDYRDFFQDKR